jgi:outer membrane scaffolding protein for murein synthesis (MipA/OmpV family)
LRFERRAQHGWLCHTSLGAVVGDRRLADTFYGVAPEFSTQQRPPYTARSGLIAWRLGTTISHQVTPDLRLFGFARVDTVSGAANNASPLVDRRTGASVGVGFTYTLSRSQRGAED